MMKEEKHEFLSVYQTLYFHIIYIDTIYMLNNLKEKSHKQYPNLSLIDTLILHV